MLIRSKSLKVWNSICSKFKEEPPAESFKNCLHWKPETRTSQKMKFSTKDFFSKCDQILSGKLHFCAVSETF